MNTGIEPTVNKETYDKLHVDFVERGRRILELEAAMRKAIAELQTAQKECANTYAYGNIRWAKELLERRLDPKKFPADLRVQEIAK